MQSKTIGNHLYIWDLRNPDQARVIGKVSLTMGGQGLAVEYHKDWLKDGYALSGDLPLKPGLHAQKVRGQLPGAMEDAMPDRWGERAIRFIEKPKRATPLDFLYFAGDRRFGALGFSPSDKVYEPHNNGPLPTADSLESLVDMIHRIEMNDPLTDQEMLVASSTKTMGGAHPKALVLIDGEDWIVKFPRGSNTDLPLIEHASLKLASQANIQVAESRALPTIFGHVVAVKRFDRDYSEWPIRLRTLSAKTVLLHGVDGTMPASELSYAAMADFLRQYGSPKTQLLERQELFRRMVFNVLIDNTDDHEKNHAFIFKDNYWSLAPAYDVLPLLANAGMQQMMIGSQGAVSNLENLLSEHARFGYSLEEAKEALAMVSEVVNNWEQVFKREGVLDSDISYMRDFIDSDEKLAIRSLKMENSKKILKI